MSEAAKSLSPMKVGFACLVGSLLLGFTYFFSAGAPVRFVAINLAAFVLGVSIVWAFKRPRLLGHSVGTFVMPLMAMALLATALLGQEAHGVSRWIVMGPLLLQPSFIFLPLMLVRFSKKPETVSTAALLVAALAIALQPDRGMAGVMVFALVTQALLSANRFVLVALAGSAVAFVATLAQPDDLPAVLHVEHVLWSSFDVHPLIGTAVVCGLALLLVPGVLGVWREGADRNTCLAFAGAWFALIMAAALGNYPTPIVGYSGAAVLGYALSAGCLPDEQALPRAAERT